MSVVGGSVPRLSAELWLEIFGHLALSGAPTTTAVQRDVVELQPHVLEDRRTLWVACQVSRQVGACARIQLYRSVLITNCTELLYFFRTLRTVPELRTLVQTFSWTGIVSTSAAIGAECVDLMPSLVTVFASMRPPVTEEDALLHRFLKIDNFTYFRAWRLLSAVLISIPRLTTLFLAPSEFRHEPEQFQRLRDIVLAREALLPLMLALSTVLMKKGFEFTVLKSLVEDPNLASIRHPPLPSLQVLILDHVRSTPPLFQDFTNPPIVKDLEELCPQLRYIQTKHSVSSARGFPRSTSMRDLVLRQRHNSFIGVPTIQRAFPSLNSLRILVTQYSTDNAKAGLFEGLDMLPKLQYLSITTPHDLSWWAPEANLTISHSLRQMKCLHHLRVDLIHLTTRANAGQLLHLASLLPPSIQSLHLLDYWGISMEDLHWMWRPAFPDNQSAVEFMRLVLKNLLQSHSSMGLTSLREVKLSSNEYDENRSDYTGARQSLDDLMGQFSQAGIRLTLTGHQEARDEEDGWWFDGR